MEAGQGTGMGGQSCISHSLQTSSATTDFRGKRIGSGVMGCDFEGSLGWSFVLWGPSGTGVSGWKQRLELTFEGRHQRRRWEGRGAARMRDPSTTTETPLPCPKKDDPQLHEGHWCSAQKSQGDSSPKAFRVASSREPGSTYMAWVA
eukprot:CAMPEP_0174369030 /NCGR_PEP_ID=MMETSP0811_2-20130205/91065_1 /TAXON_ID=73025 ORGANISM="Eutreptiella gymnastica-like, Strain CCMP1594" /NCGR_SAMPLE_ID=MMETSP0811_2 /ASSEMBLY_ACC=CAM_ASM_000667 /LENGTH=146 /DNA_ID=CAMNT_0015513061 /DNA_START=412 /DNA_END=853 /DNA_ORIENTATION=+